MRNLKKFLALVLAMMMTLSLMVTVNAANKTFTDSESVTEAFADDITVLAGMKVFEGYEDGSFGPQKNITRAEVAAIVYRIATGDWEGKQAHLYADYKKFEDVTSDKWYAGYVNYCANAEWILGYSDTKFGPADNVTGYQAAAMILRAVGYGKNGEFAGSSWQVQVANVTRSEGLLVNVDKTSYKNNLNAKAPRELVAEILFQAANIPTVTWTMLGGYNKYNSVLTNPNPTNYNPSLGYKNYGLTCDTGIVVGNQATGEDDTLIGFTGRTGVIAKGDPNTTNEFIDDATGCYAYASTTGTNLTVPFDTETGLKDFGHKVEVWYDGRDNADGYTITSGAVNEDANKTYALLDRSVLAEYVYAEDGKLSKDGAPAATDTLLGKAAVEAGFTVALNKNVGGTAANTTANLSDRYSQFDTKWVDDAAAADTAFDSASVSPVNMYYLVSNNNAKTVDVVVSLSAEVGKIAELNLTAKDKYLTLGTSVSNVSLFTNDSVESDQIYLDNLTSDSIKDIGALVCAWQVVGTASTNVTVSTDGKGQATVADPADVLYQLDAIKTTTKQVSTYKAPTGSDVITLDTSATPVINEVNFTDGTSIKLSGITLGDQTNSKIISRALPIVISADDTALASANSDVATNGVLATNIKAGASYTVYEDVLGRFISMVPADTTTFIYGTFGDYEVGSVGTGTYDYYITGVGPDGSKIENHTLTAIDLSGTMTKIKGSVGTTYNASGAFPITKKDYGTASTSGNQIKPGPNTGFMINTEGELFPYTGKKMDDTDDLWTITSGNANRGVAQVAVTETSGEVNYLLTENTQFYVVEGSGTATLKVTPYKGITALLAGGSSVEITACTGIKDQVVFWTEQDLYGTTDADSNRTIATVILSDTNLTNYGALSLYFAAPGATRTGVKLAGADADINQYKLYNDGVASTYWVKDYVSSGVTNSNDDTADADRGEGETVAESTANANGADTVGSFYTLVQIDTVAGQPIYKATVQAVNSTMSTAKGYNTGVTYNYVAVNNLNFAELKKGTGKDIFKVGSATICDVEFKEDLATLIDRSEITKLSELNNAISVKETDQGQGVYDVTVAVVYSSYDVATVYITGIVVNS